MSKHASEYFTLPGRILVLVTLVLAVGGTCLVIVWLADSLSPGRYPIWFFAMPVLLGAGIFFALCVAILKLLGIAVFKDTDQQEDSSDGI